MRPKTHIAIAVAAVVTVSAPAAAQVSGEVLAAPCASCHGTDGQSPGEIPSLTQHDASSLAAMLRGFRSGEIDATVMNRIARGYTDEEIDALAEYFGALGN